MHDPDVVRYRVSDRVAEVTLDSPANRNALSSRLTAELEAALARAAADPLVRAVLLTHTGGTFCAGVDLREALSIGMEQAGVAMVALLRTIAAHPQPVLARIDGHVRAGGLGLVAACDLVVAGPASTFAFTESRIGLAPAIISLVCSPRLTSRAVSRYYLTGETFDAAEAARTGLVTVAAADPVAVAAELLSAFRLCSPQGLAETKKLTSAALLAELDGRGAQLAAWSAGLFASDEAREGMSAFTQKRLPAWAADPTGPAAPAGPTETEEQR